MFNALYQIAVFLGRERRWIGAGFLLTAFSGFGQTFFISMSNTALRDTFGLSHGTLGLIYSLATITSAAILLEFGKLVDRVSTRTAAATVIFGLACACIVLSATPNVWGLFVAFLGLRLFGQGMMGHVAMTAAGRWYDAQRGRAVSLVTIGYPASEMVLPPLAVILIATLGLRQTWLVSSLVLVCIALPLLYGLLSKDRTPKGASQSAEAEQTTEPSSKVSWRRGHVLREPSFWLTLVGILAPPFMMTGLFFHQLHLVELKGWPPVIFAMGFSVFAVTQIASALVSGALIDRWSTRALMPAYLLPMALGLALPLMFDGVWIVFGLMFLLGLTGGAGQTLMGALWPELFGLTYLGEIRALAASAMVAASAASPFLTGYLIDVGVSFPMQLAAMSIYCVLACGVMTLIQPRLRAIATDGYKPATTE